MSFHSNRPSKRYCIFKKHSENLRGISLVCLNCDFLTDVSGLDNMATHLSQHETHTCQVLVEKVSVCIPTSEHLSELKTEAPTKGQESVSKETARHSTAEREPGASHSESEQDKAPPSEEDTGCDASVCEAAAAANCERNVTISDTENVSSSNDISSHGPDVGTDNMEKEEQTHHTCQEMELKVDQSSESTYSRDQSKEHNPTEAELSSDISQDLQLTSGGVGIGQFLRQGDEPESVNSDASEQGNVRLEPLTPSEVLEFEATEIHHNGEDPSASTSDNVSDQTGGSPGGSSPRRAESAVDLAGGKERS